MMMQNYGAKRALRCYMPSHLNGKSKINRSYQSLYVSVRLFSWQKKKPLLNATLNSVRECQQSKRIGKEM